jgi:hypothetical protein
MPFSTWGNFVIYSCSGFTDAYAWWTCWSRMQCERDGVNWSMALPFSYGRQVLQTAGPWSYLESADGLLLCLIFSDGSQWIKAASACGSNDGRRMSWADLGSLLISPKIDAPLLSGLRRAVRPAAGKRDRRCQTAARCRGRVDSRGSRAAPPISRAGCGAKNNRCLQRWTCMHMQGSEVSTEEQRTGAVCSGVVRACRKQSSQGRSLGRAQKIHHFACLCLPFPPKGRPGRSPPCYAHTLEP